MKQDKNAHIHSIYKGLSQRLLSLICSSDKYSTANYFFPNATYNFPGYYPLLFILLWYTADSLFRGADAAASITLGHGAFRPCCSSLSCSSWYFYSWHCLLHYCSSPVQILSWILQVYIWNFFRNCKAPIGCIIPLLLNLFYPVSPNWPSDHYSRPPFTHSHSPLRSTATKSARSSPYSKWHLRQLPCHYC